jgi:hypothetical protein
MPEKKRNYTISEEERKRRSERAKAQVAKGQLGGKQKGAGRPKKQRAQEHVAERIKEEGDSIFKALKDALKSESASIKLKAALAMLEVENKEEDFQRKEQDRMYDELDRAQLIELLHTRIADLEKEGVRIPLRVESEQEIIEPPELEQ